MKKHALLLLLLLTITVIKGQNNYIELNVPKVLTSEVATMMQYINHPVDLSNGVVNIEIPIYELIEGDIKIPISISYSTTGMKVREANGRLGIGWNLNAEPSISRQINGLPDERGYLVTPGNNASYAYWFGYMEDLADGLSSRDEDPDMFYYRLVNKSGKFYFNRGTNLDNPSSTITVETLPFDPIKISYTQGGSFFSKFEIRDDNGFLYKFGSGNSIGKTGTEDITWKVNEITSPTNNKVSFTYGTHLTTCTWNLTDYIVIEESMKAHSLTADLGYYVGCSNAKWPIIVNRTANALNQINNISVSSYYEGSTLKYRGAVGSTLSTCYQLNHYPSPGGNTTLEEVPLKTMETSSIKIEFVGNYFLERINVIDKITGTTIRSARFIMSYFNGQSPDAATKKKLDRVEILDKNGSIVEKYSLVYNSPTSVPNLHNKNVDHWGYYNGTTLSNTYSAVPTQQITSYYYISGHNRVPFQMTIGNANKQPSFNYASVGTLKSITYPTGRKSTFLYELNQYQNMVNDPVSTVGGLRIAEIQEHDPVSNNTLTRKFEYGKNGNGAGILKHNVTLDNYKYQKVISYGSGEPGLGLATIYSSTPFTGLFYGGGSPVFYSDVAETKYTNNIPISKTAYEYAHPNSFISHIFNTTIVLETGSPWNGGYLKKKIDYKVEEDNEFIYFKPVKVVSFEYQTYKNSTLRYGRVYRRIIFRGNTSNVGNVVQQNNGFIHQRYNHTLGCVRPISEKTEYIYGISSVVQQKTYSYTNTNHMYSTEINEYNSDGKLTTLSIKYPQDISFTPNSDEETGRTDLIGKNRLNIPLQEMTSTDSKTWVNKIKYTKDPISGITLPKSISSGQNNDIEERTLVNRYYNFGKPAQITTDAALSTVYVWGYNKQYLIAEIQNCTFSELTAVISESTLNSIATKSQPSSSDWTLLNNLRTNTSLKKAHIATCTYRPLLGILTLTDPSGKTTYYDYDNAGRLKETYIMENGNKRTLQIYDYNYRNQ